MTSQAPGKGIGARLLRKEDARHLHGRAGFVGDISMPGLMEVAFLRSPLAHARIRRIGIPPELAGQVFTAADFGTAVKPIRTPNSTPGYKLSDFPALATGKVRMVGEPVAMCVAPTRAEAEDLCQQVTLELEELPVVVDALRARQPDSALVHEEFGDNLFVTTVTDVRFEECAAGAEVVVRREFDLARVAMVPMEGKGALAWWDEGADQLVVCTSTQIPHPVRGGLATCLGMDESRIRVIAPDVGGGFGFKSMLQPEEVCLAWLALTRRHPVRWTEDVREHLLAAAKAREHHTVVTVHADRRGRILALDVEFTADIGAYSAWPVSAALEIVQARSNFPGAYVIPGYRCRTYAVATNKPPVKPYRGVARPGICLAMELTLDAVAHAVGREPAEVKLENLVPAAAMPYKSVTGMLYDSGDYPRCLGTAIEKIGLSQWRARQRAGEPDGRLVGVGFLTYIETTALGAARWAAMGIAVVPGPERATLRLGADASLEIRVGVKSHGQSLETTLAQIAHEILGIDPADISVVHGDTGITPYSIGTINSRSITMAGGAVSRTSQALAERIQRIGAHLLGCAPGEARLAGGAVQGPGAAVPIREIAQAWHARPQDLPPDIGGPELTEGYTSQVDSGAVGYGTHAVAVAVDPETGAVEILDYVVVEDCGTVVNPMVVDGQIVGGTAQGIGMALYEEMPYDIFGQPLASTLGDYLLPGAAEVPRIRIYHMEIPSPYTAHGIKGCGEGGALGAPGAIVGAINDALRPLGAELNATPATPRRILDAIRHSREGAKR